MGNVLEFKQKEVPFDQAITERVISRGANVLVSVVHRRINTDLISQYRKAKQGHVSELYRLRAILAMELARKNERDFKIITFMQAVKLLIETQLFKSPKRAREFVHKTALLSALYENKKSSELYDDILKKIIK